MLVLYFSVQLSFSNPLLKTIVLKEWTVFDSSTHTTLFKFIDDMYTFWNAKYFTKKARPILVLILRWKS